MINRFRRFNRWSTYFTELLKNKKTAIGGGRRSQPPVTERRELMPLFDETPLSDGLANNTKHLNHATFPCLISHLPCWLLPSLLRFWVFRMHLCLVGLDCHAMPAHHVNLPRITSCPRWHFSTPKSTLSLLPFVVSDAWRIDDPLSLPVPHFPRLE